MLITILVTKDLNSRAIMADVVGHKGRGEPETVAQAVENVVRLGHRSKFIIKVDNEPALVSLRDRVVEELAATGTQILVESIPAGESESNGSIENAVRLVKDMVRVHLAALQKKIAGSSPSHHPVVSWLVPHCAECITKYLVGKDGKTAYQRIFGKPARDEVFEFGERLLWRKRQSAIHNTDLNGRYLDGIWLGKRWGTHTHLVWTGTEVVEVYAFQRLPLDERWSREQLEAVTATPWNWKSSTDPQGPGRAPMLDEPVAEHEPRAPNPMHITMEDLENYGFTS